MKCFNHDPRDAVGFCRNCGRALCRDCVGIVGDLLACRRVSCETRVKGLQEASEGGKQPFRTTGDVYLLLAILCGVLGVAFLIFSP